MSGVFLNKQEIQSKEKSVGSGKAELPDRHHIFCINLQKEKVCVVGGGERKYL